MKIHLFSPHLKQISNGVIFYLHPNRINTPIDIHETSYLVRDNSRK